MECYLSHNCKKYKNNECVDFDSCIRKFREDTLFDLGLIDLNQRTRIPLRVLPYPSDPIKEEENFSILSDIERNIIKFVQDGANLYIYSATCGNGKTAWSLRLAQSYIDKIWHNTEMTCKVLYISVPKFLLELKANISRPSTYIEHIHKYVLTADLVIWDDIGSKLGTEFEIENMLSIINNRLDNGKSNIYTSNIIPENLEQILGPRLSSRVLGMSKQINLLGRDKRGLKF